MYRQYTQKKKRSKLLMSVLILMTTLLLWSPILYSYAITSIPEAEITTFSALLIDAKRGQVLYSKNADEWVQSPLASKLMTVWLALENTEPDAMVTASTEAVSIENASLNLRVGEKYTVESLLYATLLTSADEAAFMLAEHLGGTTDRFVERMNETAALMGLSNTRFANATGRSDPSQYTTATDMALFLRTALANADFAKLFRTQAKPWYDNQKTILMTNRNRLFWSFDGTDGGVSATVGNETNHIITTATRNNMRLILVQLEAPDDTVDVDAESLFSFGFNNFRYGTLVTAGQILRSEVVNNQTINLVTNADITYIYPVGENYVTDLSISIDDAKLMPPIKKTDVLGVATYTLGDGTVITIDLHADKEWLPEKTWVEIVTERLKNNNELLILIGVLVAIECVMILTKATHFFFKKTKTQQKKQTDTDQ